MPNPADHLLAVFLVAVVPSLLKVRFRRLIARVQKEGGKARRRAYTSTIVSQWCLVFAVAAMWILADRPFAALRLSVPRGWGFVTGVAVFVLLAAFLSLQLRGSATNVGLLDAVRAKLGHVRAILPHDRADLRRFSMVAITAGICEEILFRGFLAWYAAQYVPASLAILLAAIAFGLAHAYQGPRGVLVTAIFGLVMAGLCVVTGSLWVAMAVHALIDLNSGCLARRAFADTVPA